MNRKVRILSWTIAQLSKRKTSLIGFSLVFCFIIIAIFAPLLSPYDPYRINLRENLQHPSLSHLFGTDALGRDILSRILFGSRLTLSVGMSGVAFGAFLGCILGITSGYYGGWLDEIIMRFIDLLYAFPAIILAIIIISIIGTGLWNVALAIGVFSVSVFARVARVATLEVKKEKYVEAARAIGASDIAIVSRHFLPNIAMPIIIIATVRLAQAVLVTCSLGFLGLGAPPDMPEWGAMLSSGRDFLESAPHLTVFPGLFISLSVFGFHLAGDALRDLIDPRYRTEV